MTAFQKVLIPVDFSPASQTSFRQAALLARGSQVELVHVVEPMLYNYPPLMSGAPPVAAELQDNAVRRARETMQQLAQGASMFSPPPHTEICVGPLPDALVDRAKEMKADLIVVSTHGRTGLERWMLGSVSEKLVRRSPCPIAVARQSKPEQEPKLQSVLVGVDFSEHSQRALALASQLCTEHGASLEVFHAWSDPFIGEDGVLYAELIGQVRDGVKAQLADFVSRAELPAEVSVKQTCVAGLPTSALHDRLKDTPPDLVVLGTHGRRGVQRVLLGSVAEATVRYAPCTTLIVP